MKKHQYNKCTNCGDPLTQNKIKRHSKFCCLHCRQEDIKKKYAKLNPSSGFPSNTVGAINELKVAINLMQRGFSVFRALSPSCTCDLAVLDRKGSLVRIEVTTGSYTTNRKLVYPKHNPANYDVIAVVMRNGEIRYEGSLLDVF